MSDDTLGELYAWDSVIEDDFALPEDQRDEDESLEAYEGIIYAANPENKAADGVLSLAAMLLTKHFTRFPHVQLNVVNVLLELCGASHSQAVRIHSLRSLTQVVKPIAADKAPADIDNTIAWVQRIIEVVGGLGITETSTVIQRHMSPLTEALKATMQALQQWKQGAKSSKEQTPAPADPVDDTTESPKTSVVRKDREDDQGRSVELERASKRTKRADDAASSPVSGRRENENTSNNHSINDDSKDDTEPSKAQRGRKDILSRLDTEASTASISKVTVSSKCPPSRFVFIGNIPAGTVIGEMTDYMANVPDVRAPRVSLRSNNTGPRALMYAFVTMPTIPLSRKIIDFVRSTPFHGRTLGCSFARGHPVQMMTFVERCGDVNSEENYDVQPFDFESCSSDVWEELLSLLKRYGDFHVVHEGKVCFSTVEDAKNAIRMIFHVQGHEIIPVYDIDEQIPSGGPRSYERREGFTLKSGRQVGDPSFRSGTANGARDDRRPRDADRRRDDDRYDDDRRRGDDRWGAQRDDNRRYRLDVAERRDDIGQRDDGRRDVKTRRDSRRDDRDDLPTSSRSNFLPRMAEDNVRHRAGSRSRSPSSNQARRDSAHRRRDVSSARNDHRGRSPPRSRSPAPASSLPFQQIHRASGPRDISASRRDKFASRSRSPKRDGRVVYDSFDKKRVDTSIHSHSPIDARSKTNDWRHDRASPPRQRGYGTPQRMEGPVPPPDVSSRRHDSFDRKDRREMSSNQLHEERGRPRERDDRPRGPPQDVRDERGMPVPRYGTIPSGPLEYRGKRFSPPRHDGGPPRRDIGPPRFDVGPPRFDAAPPRRDIGLPTEAFLDRRRYGSRDEPPPFKNSPIPDRYNGLSRRSDERHRSRSRTRSRSPGPMMKFGGGGSRTPPLPDGRPHRVEDRSDFRPRPSRPDGRPGAPASGRNEQFDRQHALPQPSLWNHRENGNGEPWFPVGRYGPATDDQPASNPPPRSNDLRPLNDGPARDQTPERSFQPPRSSLPPPPRSSLPPPPRPGDFAPRERRSPPPPPKFQPPNARDNERSRVPEPERKAFDTPPRQANAPRDMSPPPSPLLARDSSSHRKSHESRRESREKHRSSEKDRSDRKRDKEYRKSKERHSSRHDKRREERREERHRERKRSRHSDRDAEDATSPAPAKRARSMTPSPVRRSPQKSVNAGRDGKDAKDSAPARPVATNDPFDDMDELAVDFEDDE